MSRPTSRYSIDDVDRAMRWGFGWELGPFEIWDAIGVREVLAAAPALDVPPLVAGLLDAGDEPIPDRRLPPAGAGSADSRSRAKDRAAGRPTQRRREPRRSWRRRARVEFHSKMNAIGGDTIQMLHAGVKEAAANFAALVVGNDAPNFSAGANLMLRAARSAGRQLGRDRPDGPRVPGRHAGAAYADVPVVVAPAGLTLGGGCEIALHGDRVQAAAESYIGLVEVGVGLIPAAAAPRKCWRARWTSAPDAVPTCCRSCSGCSRRSASRRSRPAPRMRARSASSAMTTA